MVDVIGKHRKTHGKMVDFIGKPMGKPMGKPIYTLVGGLEHGFYDFSFDVTGFG